MEISTDLLEQSGQRIIWWKTLGRFSQEFPSYTAAHNGYKFELRQTHVDRWEADGAFYITSFNKEYIVRTYHATVQEAVTHLVKAYFEHHTKSELIKAKFPTYRKKLRKRPGKTKDIGPLFLAEIALKLRQHPDSKHEIFEKYANQVQVYRPEQYIKTTILCNKCGNVGTVEGIAFKYIYSLGLLLCGPCIDHYQDQGVISANDYDTGD